MVLIVILFTLFVMYRINIALKRLEFKQEVLCYDIYILNREAKREEKLLLKELY